MLLGTTFREWKAWTFEQAAARKYDSLRMEHEIAEREWGLKVENQEKEHERRLQVGKSRRRRRSMGGGCRWGLVLFHMSGRGSARGVESLCDDRSWSKVVGFHFRGVDSKMNLCPHSQNFLDISGAGILRPQRW